MIFRRYKQTKERYSIFLEAPNCYKYWANKLYWLQLIFSEKSDSPSPAIALRILNTQKNINKLSYLMARRTSSRTLCFLLSLYAVLLGIARGFLVPLNQSLTIEPSDLDSRETHLRFNYSFIPLCPIQQTDLLSNPLITPVLTNVSCRQLCTISLNEDTFSKYTWLIDHSYELFFWLGNEEAALYRTYDDETGKASYDMGMPIGTKDKNNTYYVNTHYEYIVTYKNASDTHIDILDFIVDSKSGCARSSEVALNSTGLNKLTFTYSITYQQAESHIQLPKQYFERIKWLIFAVLINLVYCIAIAGILYRSLLQDLHNCARRVLGSTIQQFVEMAQERESGWKQHQREAFRPPSNKMLISAFVGAGAQVLVTLILTIAFMAYQSYRYLELDYSQATSVAKTLIVLTSGVAGYVSARVYKMWGGQFWIGTSLLTSSLVPLAVGMSLLIDNLMRLLESAIAYSVSQMTVLPAVWLSVSLLVGLVGSFIGQTRKAIRNPFSVNLVEQRRKYSFGTTRQLVTALAAAVVPYMTFGAEYRLILDSFWQHSAYETYGFLAVSGLMLLISCALASILTTYLSLNKQPIFFRNPFRGNPKWWSIPLMTCGGLCALLVCVQVIYLIVTIHITRLTSIVIYFCWSFMAVWLLFLACSASTFILTVIFVRRIFAIVKLD